MNRAANSYQTIHSIALYALIAMGIVTHTTTVHGQVIHEDYKLLADDGGSGDHFGWSVAIDNGIIAVGADGEENGQPSGAAYLFRASTGVQSERLVPNDGVIDNRFGTSIAIDGGIVVVGAHWDEDNGTDSGAAYLFSAATGVQIAKIHPNNGKAFDRFGYRVAIGGGVIAIGADGDDDFGNESGSVYLFSASSGGQIAKLIPNDGAPFDFFGISVSISNGVVAVGARNDDDNGSNSGSAYLFDVATGVQIAKILPSDGSEFDRFGSSIAINNGIVAVGATDDDDNGNGSGSVYLFDASNGAQLFKLLPSDGAAGDRFGHSIAIDNGVVAVGARDDDENGSNSGSAYLFDVSTGEQLVKLLPSDGSGGHLFGQSISIDNGIVVAGADRDNDNGATSGSAYLFGEVESTFITHTVHGQVPEEFNPFASPGPPAWITSVTDAVELNIDAANTVRDEDDDDLTGAAAFIGTSTDWAEGTGEGTPLIAFSRALYIASLFGNLNPITNLATTLAADVAEIEGRKRAGVAARVAGRQMHQSLRSSIMRVRKQHGEEHPIFLDIVAHSRGTTVASDALARLSTDPEAFGPLEVNVVYADIIDAHESEPDETRPLALAGHLLNDPIVRATDNERIHHLVSECAAFCADPDCSSEGLWFFTGEQLCELEALGVLVGDESLRTVFGYPRGHVRPYLNAEVDQIEPNSTHSSVIDDFVATATGLVVDQNNTDTPPLLSFASRTAVGRFLTTGLLEETPELVPFRTGDRSLRGGAGSESFVIDPNFTNAGTFMMNASVILADPTMDGILSDAFQAARDLLTDAATSDFPAFSSWEPTGSATLIEETIDEYGVVITTGGIAQTVEAPAAHSGSWRVLGEITLHAPGSAADILIDDGQGSTHSWSFSTAGGDPTDTILTLNETFTWLGESHPTISISGSDFTVHNLDLWTLAPCPADLNGDGVLDFFDVQAFLGAFAASDPVADFNGDGIFDFFDIQEFLNLYSAGCP
jgi:FG-GAP repeat protein